MATGTQSMKKPRVRVVQPDEPAQRVTYEILATAVRELAQGVKKLRASPLNDRAIILLLHDTTGISKRDIQSMLDSMENLERTYLKPGKKSG